MSIGISVSLSKRTSVNLLNFCFFRTCTANDYLTSHSVFSHTTISTVRFWQIPKLASTVSRSISVSLILACSCASFSSYWIRRECSFFWLISSSSISFCLMEISQVNSARSSWMLSESKHNSTAQANQPSVYQDGFHILCSSFPNKWLIQAIKLPILNSILKFVDDYKQHTTCICPAFANIVTDHRVWSFSHTCWRLSCYGQWNIHLLCETSKSQ